MTVHFIYRVIAILFFLLILNSCSKTRLLYNNADSFLLNQFDTYFDLNDTQRSNLKVSILCLGTMSFGEQNTEKEAHEQLNYALEHNINFLDTAEMYSVPPKEDTYGLTEKYIGSWLKHQKRENIIIATNIF